MDKTYRHTEVLFTNKITNRRTATYEIVTETLCSYYAAIYKTNYIIKWEKITNEYFDQKYGKVKVKNNICPYVSTHKN